MAKEQGNPELNECPNPKDCTVPGAVPASWIHTAQDSTGDDPNVNECPNPKDCTVPGVSALLDLDLPNSTPVDPDLNECPNPKDCTVPGASLDGDRA